MEQYGSKVAFIKMWKCCLLILSILNWVECSWSPQFIWENFVAASTNDLQRLFSLESELLDNLDKWMYKVQSGEVKITSLVKEDVNRIEDTYRTHKVSSWRDDDPLSYVYHPINAFHLIKRTTTLWPQLFEDCSLSLEDATEEELTRFPALDDLHYGASVGLVNIELYYKDSGNTFISLAKGIVMDPATNIAYQARHNLTHSDMLMVAEAARRVWRLDKHVEWTEAALEVAKIYEELSDMEVRKLKTKLQMAKDRHDDALIENGINRVSVQGAPDGQPSSPIFTALRPFNKEYEEIPSYVKSKKRYKKELEVSTLFVDLRPLDQKDDSLYMEKSFVRMRTAMLPISKRLCNGDSSLRLPSKDAGLHCVLLDYGHPYLRLGPFKYEPLNTNPHVGMFRDFYGHKELDSLIVDTSDKLHSTTYNIHNGETRYYTSQRSSKRRHVNDDDHPVASVSSRRISLATRWLVHQSPWASEHYHVINYGIGGQIEVHVDHWGPGKYKHPGGARTVTFLGYGSNTLVGGYTIFPGLGLHVKPQKGDALFWLTVKNDGEYDSRMFHMGCPVVYGNKWVVTKWLYSDDQMWVHPCNTMVGNFPTFSNQQSFPSQFYMYNYDDFL